MRGQGRIRTIGVCTVLVTALTGCAPWLAANPQFATDSARNPGSEPTTAATAGGPPTIATPKNDLSWKDCTESLFREAGAPPAPGVQLQCAEYDADLDPISGATGTLTIGAVRARSAQTPADAGPLVFTSGSDLPSSLQLPVWLSRSGADVLKTHPIVAVDRRGMGRSSPIDCRDAFDRDVMRNQAQFDGGDDPVAALGTVTTTATTGCTDKISPGDSAYDNARAAEDLERLRSNWDVPALALIGIGNGAQVAMAYAGSHPEKVARLVLDSPIAPGVVETVLVENMQLMTLGDELEITLKPCVIALDGERELEIKKDRNVSVRLSEKGPRVVDVEHTMACAKQNHILLTKVDHT